MKKRFIFLSLVLFIIILVFVGINNNEEILTEKGIDLELIAEGFVSPVEVVSVFDDSKRLFVVDRVGIIWIIKDNKLVEKSFLDITDKVVELRSQFDERGLLGLAFHPDFKDNGRLFVYYSSPLRESASSDWDHTARISEFRVSLDSNQANISSEKIIIEIDEPQFNHDGGKILFGPDGYLYVALGDGGEANDLGIGHPEKGNGQDINTLLGSILRIDVDVEIGYGIPLDNPFVGKEGRDEIFAYGFRNPYRMSFDSNGRLFVGDVGQDLLEEIDIVEKGKNYGWRIMEGSECFDVENPDKFLDNCSNVGLEEPIIEYGNSGKGGIGLSVIGGHVYEGTNLENFSGDYIFGDWSSSFIQGKGLLFSGKEENGFWKFSVLKELDSFLLSIGKDEEGELYILTSNRVGPIGNTGKLFKIVSNK